MAPPGMPNTTSAPTLSNDRTSDWAPVSSSDIADLPSSLRGQQKTPRAEHGGVSALAGDGALGGGADELGVLAEDAGRVARLERLPAGPALLQLGLVDQQVEG